MVIPASEPVLVCFGVNNHGAKFWEIENTPPLADSLLPEHYRAAALHLDRNSDHRKHRKQYEQQQS